MRRRWIGAALLLPAACGGDRPAEETAWTLRDVAETERAGGTAVLAGGADAANLNPLVSTDYLASQIQKHLLFMTLVRYDAESILRPYLAESWELNGDSTQIVFRLRQDVPWHDGAATGARDVAFTFNRIKDPEVAYPNRESFDLWEGAEVLDSRTIRFVFQPHAGFLHGFTQLPILPEHLLGDVPADELASHPFGTTEPVGNGPFRFAERRPGDRWVFEANPEFPDALGGRPYLDRVVYRAVPDETTLLSELLTGGVHLRLNLPPAQIARVESDPELEVLTFPSRSYTFIAWNSLRPQFREVAVRRALTMAIDRAALLEAVRNGLGVLAAGPVGPWHWARDPAAEPLPFAPDSSAALLEAAGWIDRDGDGVRDKEDRSLRFDLASNDNRIRQDIALVVQAQLAAVGVDARPLIQESASLGAAITSPDRRYDAVLLTFDQDWELDDRSLWACDQVGQPFQFTSYCNPALDPILDSIPLALDRETRTRLYRTYDRMIATDQPYTFLYFETVAAGLRRELRDVRLDARGELAGVRDWWMHPDHR